MLWYSLEASRQGTSNEYQQHMFSLRNKKNIHTFWLKKVPCQVLCFCPKAHALCEDTHH